MKTQKWNSPPTMRIDTEKVCRALMKTDRGDIELELYPQQAPQTVNIFVFLIQEGFYNGVTFHLVISDFMIQVGDPTGTGSGGP